MGLLVPCYLRFTSSVTLAVSWLSPDKTIEVFQRQAVPGGRGHLLSSYGVSYDTDTSMGHKRMQY